MDVAVHCSNLTWPGGPAALGRTLADVAKTADQGGVKTLTLMDHYFQMENLGGPPEPMLEGYTSLGFLAGQTENLELGLLVTGVTYRHPGLLAKIVTTLDVLSQGRALLGLGAAWYEREHLGLGVPFPPLAERFERLEETLQIVQQMWSVDDGPYAGSHYQLKETIAVPPPLQPGGPRIMIGGSGEKKTFRLVATYADACNLFAPSVEVVAGKLEALSQRCDEAERNLADIEKTIIGGVNPLDDVDSFLSSMEEFAAIGITKVFVGPDAKDPVAWTNELCEKVIPRLSEI